MAIVVLVTGSIGPILVGLQGGGYNSSRVWPWTYVAGPVLGLVASAIVVWLSARLARQGLSFALLLCAAFLAYSFANPTLLDIAGDPPVVVAVSLSVAAWANSLALAAATAVLTRRFPAMGRAAQRNGVLLLLACLLTAAFIQSVAFTIDSSDGGSVWDWFLAAAYCAAVDSVVALVLLGVTLLLARRYLRPTPVTSRNDMWLSLLILASMLLGMVGGCMALAVAVAVYAFFVGQQNVSGLTDSVFQPASLNYPGYLAAVMLTGVSAGVAILASVAAWRWSLASAIALFAAAWGIWIPLWGLTRVTDYLDVLDTPAGLCYAGFVALVLVSALKKNRTVRAQRVPILAALLFAGVLAIYLPHLMAQGQVAVEDRARLLQNNLRTRSFAMTTHSVKKYNSEGTLLAEWGGGEGIFRFPRGIALGPDGNVFVSDLRRHQVRVFDPSGSFLSGWPIGATWHQDVPPRMSIDQQGNVYLIYPTLTKVYVHGADGTLLHKLGSLGTSTVDILRPRSIAFDTSNNAYLVEWWVPRIVKLDARSKFVSEWGIWIDGDSNDSPQGIAVNHSGEVYVTYVTCHCIQVFTTDGVFLRAWGSKGSDDGQFDDPRGIAIDGLGRVYVVNRGNLRIQVFTTDGGFLRKWDAGDTLEEPIGAPSGYYDRLVNAPHSIAVDLSGTAYVATDGVPIPPVRELDDVWALRIMGDSVE